MESVLIFVSNRFGIFANRKCMFVVEFIHISYMQSGGMDGEENRKNQYEKNRGEMVESGKCE